MKPLKTKLCIGERTQIDSLYLGVTTLLVSELFVLWRILGILYGRPIEINIWQ